MKLSAYWTSHDVTLLTLIIVTTVSLIRASVTPSSCANTQVAYTAFGYDGNDVPKQPVAGSILTMCKGTPEVVCCSPEMEVTLETRSREEHDVKMTNLTRDIGRTFRVHANKFDNLILELLNVSQTELDDMFVTTYGNIYQSNLFKDLEDYYTKGKINPLEAVKNFFDGLLKKLFSMYNKHFHFTDQYFDCLVEQSEKIKPFGDVPQKLSVLVRKSFVAARTFVRALEAGHEIVKKILEISHGSACGLGLLNMNYCQMCVDSPDLKQCSGHCVNAIRKCVVSHPELDAEWDTYIASLLVLAERLKGPFNIEHVVHAINIRISDAIMNFQEDGSGVTKQVFTLCGRPRLVKRETPDLEDKMEPPGRPMFVTRSSLLTLMREIHKKLEPLKDFWKDLPHQYCHSNPQVVPLASEEECWDGMKITKNNPVEDVMGKPNAEVNELISLELNNLRLMTNKLKNAYNGLDVDRIELESCRKLM